MVDLDFADVRQNIALQSRLYRADVALAPILTPSLQPFVGELREGRQGGYFLSFDFSTLCGLLVGGRINPRSL